MPPPFHSLENPFEPPKKRLQDDAELIGKFLGRAAEEEMRKIMAKEKRKPDVAEPDWTPIRLSDKEKARIEALNTPLMKQEAAKLTAFFGEYITVPPLPREITPERIKNWETMGFELHYLPPMDMTEDADFPGWEKKPQRWFYEEIAAGRIAKDATMLPGAWVLVDGRQKPKYDYGKQMYENDPLGDALAELRQKGLVQPHGHVPDPHSRFGISADELSKPEVIEAFAEVLHVRPDQLTLPTATDFNVIGNIHHPEWDDTDNWEWFQDSYQAGQRRLYGGASWDGGLSGVHWDDADNRNDNIAFRPSVRFSP
ncbi:hypothetical protein A3E39_02570 [Candidatus Uhrbacteria bacterium RIFCSPHIGHO2_12_FULL_60_25]|uniref:Uncharacterized protein n=1 Tax=Candidatus Uhrbacteria bacterium RIFCSPHIGHO2_12_FULL_60_25 TaxID=1802399 RepID=A0A1F7ULI3_9BACT|nr:MAG: hypothetical protein A3E39_02570 [Candidatus Uhrbacteria bacterium RIFCSPHIGHO2_12_FULL_60_25]